MSLLTNSLRKDEKIPLFQGKIHFHFKKNFQNPLDNGEKIVYNIGINPYQKRRNPK